MRPSHDLRRDNPVALAPPPRPTRSAAQAGRSRSTLLVVLATIALVCVPIAIVEWPREMARWHAAAAGALDLQGEPAAAVARMDQAIAWNDRDAQLFVQRAEYKARLQQWQSALEDCDRAREVEPDSPLVGAPRSALLQHLGRHEEAVGEWREILKQGRNVLPQEHALQLNNLAYAAAVGNVHLEEGLAAAEQAVQISVNATAMRDPGGVLYFGRAVTAQQQSDNLLALSCLSEARSRAEAAWLAVSRKAEVQAEVDPRLSVVLTDEVESLRAHLAGILKLRIDICERLGKSEDAARDKQRREELTVDGNLAEVEPYGFLTAFARVHDCAVILDTRGYLYYKLQDPDAALDDLEMAVPAGEWTLRAMPWLIEAIKHNKSDIRPSLRQQEETKRAVAVIIYHRAQVLESLGQQQAAQQDLQRVRDLGYEPDEHLF